MTNKIFKTYSKFVGHNPVLVLTISIAITILAIIGIQMMETKTVDYQDMLPEEYDAIKAFNLIEADFGSTTSANIVIEIENTAANSNEPTTVLDPQVIRYSLKLENYLVYVDDIESISGLGQVIQEEYQRIPNSIEQIRNVSHSTYASPDETMLLITLTLSDEVNDEALTEEIQEYIQELEKPQGIKVSLSGSVFEDVIVDQEMSSDMSKTGMLSMAAIIIILFLLFRTIKGVILPLMTIIFGMIWTFGYLGLSGGGLSSMTSGVVSMIMGIGIDFGIQIMSRYNQELKTPRRKNAMENTLNGTLFPILTTALACLIGFKAMGLGELSMMAEMGQIMSYGVVFCMAAAITIVPALLVLTSKNKIKPS